MNLSDFQQDFIRAVYADGERQGAAAELAAQPGFAVYRNTILKGCVDNLAANFPTVVRLVGEEWFRATALVFARGAPPRHTSLFEYSPDFPDFLASYEPAADLSYLAGVARLDRLWVESHTAADAAVLAASALSGIAPAALGEMRLQLHAAARWIWFEQHPSCAIWIANREQRDVDDTLPWQGDGALLTRPDGAVRWMSITHGTAAFLDACAGEARLQEAALHALTIQPDLDIAAMLAVLIPAGAFHLPSREPSA